MKDSLAEVRSWHSRWNYPLLLFSFGIIVFWKLIFINQYTILAYPDSSFQTYPWAQYLAEMVHRGSFPFWDVYSEAGRTFVGEIQTGAFYPLNLLMAVMPLNASGLLPVSLIEGFLVLHVILASWFMYGLARHFSISPFSSCVAGIIFAYGGSVGGRVSAQVNLFHGVVWIPAVFWCFAKSLEAQGIRRQILFANLTGLALAMTLVAGHHQPFLYTGLTLGGISLVLCAKKSISGSFGPRSLVVRQTALLFAFAAAYASLQLLPSIEYSHLAFRWVSSAGPSLASERIPYELAGSQNVLSPNEFILMMFPYLTSAENSPYLGTLSLLLILLACTQLKRNPIAKMCCLLALAGAMLSIGSFSPAHGLMYSLIPAFDKGREAARIFMISHFALSLLAGYGAEVLIRPAGRVERQLRGTIMLGFACVVMILCLIAFGIYFYKTQVLRLDPAYGAQGFALVLLIGTATIAIARHFGWLKGQSLRAAMVLLLLFDFHSFLAPHMKAKRRFDRKANFEPKKYYQNDHLTEFLRGQPGTFRVDFRDEYYPNNGGQVFKLDTINGYGATKLKQFHLFQHEDYPPGGVISDMLNVRYIVSTKALDLPVAFQGQHATVFENPGYLPRAWLVARAEVRKDLAEMVPLLRSPGFDPGELALLEESLGTFNPIPISGGPKDQEEEFAKYTPISANRFRVDTETKLPRLLVVSQNWYPGWCTTVNGQSRKLVRVDGALMGVAVEAGRSVVEFRYRPSHFMMSVGLTLSAFLVLGACLLGSLRK